MQYIVLIIIIFFFILELYSFISKTNVYINLPGLPKAPNILIQAEKLAPSMRKSTGFVTLVACALC